MKCLCLKKRSSKQLFALFELSVGLCDIARIAGYLISLTIALGPIARFFTRHMYFVVAFGRSWRDYVYVSEHLSQELKFGLQRVDAFNGYHITLEDNFALQLLFIVTLAIRGLAVFPLS